MPSYVDTMQPLVEEFNARKEAEMQENIARVKAARAKEGEPKPREVKDANHLYYQKCVEEGRVMPRQPLPTEEELAAARAKVEAMSLEERYKTSDKAEQLFLACKHLQDEHVVRLLKEGTAHNFKDKVRAFASQHCVIPVRKHIQPAFLLSPPRKFSA